MEALIRVAKQQSNIKFNTIKAYRALTLSDVPIILKRNSSIDVLIIEDMQPDEIEAVKELSSTFKGKVYTFGRIKLNNIDNFISLSDLQDKVNQEFYIESHTYGSKRSPVIYTEVFTETGELYLGDNSERPLSLEDKVVKVSLSKESIKDEELLIDDLLPDDSIFGSFKDDDNLDKDIEHQIEPLDNLEPKEIEESVEIDNKVDESLDTEVFKSELQSDLLVDESLVENDLKTDIETTEEDIVSELESINDEDTDTIKSEKVEIIDKKEVNEEVTSSVNTKRVKLSKEPIIDTKEEDIVESTKEENVIKDENEETTNVKVEELVQIEPSELKSEVTDIINTEVVESEFGEELNETLPIIDIKKLKSYDDLLDKDKDLVDTLISEVNYYRDVINKFSSSEFILSFKEEREKYKSELIVLENKLNSSTSIDELKSLQLEFSKCKMDFENERKNLLNKISEIENLSKTEKENIVLEAQKASQRLEKELSDLKAQQQHKEESLDSSNQIISELEQKVTSLSISNNHLIEDYTDTLNTLRGLSVKYIDLLDSHNKEVARAQATVNQYKAVLGERAELEGKLTELNIQLNAERQKKSETVRASDLKLAEFAKLQEQIQLKLDEEISRNQTLELKMDNLEAKLLASDKQKTSALEQVNGLLEELSNKNILLESKETVISDLNLKLESIKRENEEALEVKQQLSVTDLATQSLQKEIGRIQIENRENLLELEKKDKRIGELAKANQMLTNQVQALSRSISTGSKLEFSCKYSGKGFILPVFGSGSYGVTTSAVSIAQQLFSEGNSVLLMDLDLVSPKCNAYLNKPAIQSGLDELTGIKGKLANTCLGVLMLKDTSFFLSQRHNLIQRISTSKKNGKTFDFFNGLYADIEIYKFANINWDELMNTLGNQYDYIILDLGRFGGGNEQNALIKMFTSMSLRYLAITPKDKDDIRNLLLKISAYKLDLSKLVWMLNMAEDTKVDDFITEKALKNIPYRIITIKTGMIGKRATFTDALLKGQFKGIVDLLTLKEMK